MTPLSAVEVLGVLAVPALPQSDLSGRVLFTGAPVPGATITATHGDRTVATLSDEDGRFRLANLEDGTWRVRIERRGFVAVQRDVTLPFIEPVLEVALTMRPLDQSVDQVLTVI